MHFSMSLRGLNAEDEQQCDSSAASRHGVTAFYSVVRIISDLLVMP